MPDCKFKMGITLPSHTTGLHIRLNANAKTDNEE
jgi:hypothetical protein